MPIEYAFSYGQRVRHAINGWDGEVISMVPGDGRDPWYFVRWEHDGSEDRYQAHMLVAI